MSGSSPISQSLAASVAPFFRRTTQAPWLAYVGHRVKILVRGSETNGALSVMEAIVRKGFEPSRHVHRDDDEAYFVIEGTFHFEVGGVEHVAESGDFVFLPRGVPHSWSVDRSGARTLWLASPGGIDELFEELGEPTDSDELPEPPDPFPMERMRTLLQDKFHVYLAPRDAVDASVDG